MMKPTKKRPLLRTIITLLGLNTILLVTLFITFQQSYAWEHFYSPIQIEETPVITPPDPPPSVPMEWPEREKYYDCTMRPPIPSDYAIMAAVSTHNEELMDQIPSYIRHAIRNAKERIVSQGIPEHSRFELRLKYGSLDNLPPSVINELVPPDVANRLSSQINISNLLEYINYEDMKQLVLLINRDARRFHGEPYWGFDRYLWVEEFTGVQYDNHTGFPRRNEAGEINYRRQTTWQYIRELTNPLDIPKIVYSFSRGLFNKDPRVRLQCLSILREMGPSPSVQLAVQQAGQLYETVGNYTGFQGWGLRFDIPENVDPDDVEEQRSNEVVTRRYVYCDIDAAPHWSVPYFEFQRFNNEINRMIVLHKMEVSDELEASDFRVIDENMFVTITDSINIRGVRGLDRASFYGIALHRHPETNERLPYRQEDIQSYPLDNDSGGILPEYEFADSAKNIPKNLYVRNQSAFNYLVQKVLMPWNPGLPPEVWDHSELTEEETERLIHSMFAALEHRNYYVRVRAARFLYQMYRSSAISQNNQKLILGATLTNRTLRETMKAEFIPRKRIERMHLYIAHQAFDGLREDMIQYDEELGDTLFERFQVPRTQRTHTDYQPRRNPDGTPINSN